MKKIKEFRFNLDQNSSANMLEIRKIIDEFGDQKHIRDLNFKLSELLEIPEEIISKKTKQIVYGTFDYKENNPKFKINFNFYDSLKYFFCFLIFTILRKDLNLKESKKTKVDIILDNVEKRYVVEKFKKLLTFFNRPLILTNKRLKKQTEEQFKHFQFVDEHFAFLKNNILKNKKFSLLNFIFELVSSSLKLRLNLLRIYFPIFYTSLKYYKIFNIYNSKILVFDRIYHTCPVRNYIFKKCGGKKILCLQSHLAEGTISLFSDVDTLVTFGKEKYTEKKLRLLGGKINETFCCGSMRMEHGLENLDYLNQIENIDILLIGLNPYSWLNTSKVIPKIYYEHIEWVVKVSKINPKLKIVYKHHPNFKGDTIEDDILKDSNIKKIVKPKKNLNSYHFLMKSKLIVSFGSSMILEALSLRKKCFFLDPGLKNSAFFGNLDYLDKIRISNFEDFNKLAQTINEQSTNFDVKISDEFCLSHNKVSERIFNNIKEFNENF